MEPNVRQWAAYTDAVPNPGNPGGRKFLGFCGWHADRASALAAAFERYPVWEPARITVSAV